MATPGSAQTRQQLQELDSLIERMLAMPSSHLSEAEAAKPASRLAPEAFLPLPTDQPLPEIRVYPQEASTHGGRASDSVQGWRIEFPAGPRYITGIPSQIDSPAMAPTEVSAPVAPAVAEVPFAQPVESASPRLRQRRSMWGLLDAAFCTLFGWIPLIGLLTRGWGKTLLGWLGIGLLLAAGAWAYLDYTQLRWSNPSVNSKIAK